MIVPKFFIFLISLKCSFSSAIETNALESPSENPPAVGTKNEAPKEVGDPKNGDSSKFETLKPMRSDPNEEILISKDTLIPFLKTIVLAYTHKEDPSYEEILKISGKTLLKQAEKKIGDDKYMQGLLKIIRKYVENFHTDAITDKDQDILGELAEEYLKNHKFRIIFPESLLLHQKDLESFVAKKKELGLEEGRQLNFDVNQYFKKLTQFASSIKARFSGMNIFKNLNLDRIGTTFDSIGESFEEYLPAIRMGPGLADVGISVGSLTALAAAGALISAPFFLSRFGGDSDAEEDDYDPYYNHRREGGGVAPQQLLSPPAIDNDGLVIRPQWLDTYERDQSQGEVSDSKSQEYQEPQEYLSPPQYNSAGQDGDDEAYSKYLNEYNQWLQQYHNAVSQQQNADQEYEEYYKKYREWYNQYYQEQFGESAPVEQYQPLAPNGYEDPSSILGMHPPPPLEEYQSISKEDSNEATILYQGTSKIPAPKPERENPSFQVIHVDENGNKRAQIGSVNQNNLKFPAIQKSPLVGFSRTSNAYQQQLKAQNVSPSPVYIQTQAPAAPLTQGGFQPLAAGSEQYVVVIKPKPTDHQVEPLEVAASTTSEQKVEPVQPGDNFVREDVVKNNEISGVTQASAPLFRVTSGIFRTPPQPTAKADTTPQPKYYKKPYNKSVRVVTSKSVVTSLPFVKAQALKFAATEEPLLNKRKITLPELLKRNKQALAASLAAKSEDDKVVSDRDFKVLQAEKENEENKIGLFSKPIKEEVQDEKKEAIEDENDLPIYALDPFYGPRLSRTDAIFHQLSLPDEGCREQVVCNMYKNPNAFTPLSDFLSRQLTVTYDQLKRPTVNDERILRFFKYLQAARAGQDGFDCIAKYPNCDNDTTKLSYKPIVNAYKKVSVLMNSS